VSSGLPERDGENIAARAIIPVLVAEDAYRGEIRLIGFDYAPEGWAFCNGSTLPIRDHPDLFKILGTTYGGDGKTTFALPDYRAFTVAGPSAKFPLGKPGDVARGSQGNSHDPACLALHYIIALESDTPMRFAEAYIGEIRPFAGDFIPNGWTECDGSLFPIELFMTAFALLDNRFGGDRARRFAVPDLRGCTPVGADAQYPLGTQFGSAIDASATAGEIAYVPLRYIICLEGIFPSRPV
jgi:microcystin-dependent protein